MRIFPPLDDLHRLVRLELVAGGWRLVAAEERPLL